MKVYTALDKRKAVEAGEREFGSDFFMVDPSGSAAPFRIATEQDVATFVNFSNPCIPWVASQHPRYEERASTKSAGVM
jgi:hypothetical protein